MQQVDDAEQEARIEAAGSAWRPPPGGARLRRRLNTATGVAWFEGAVRSEAHDDDPDAPRLHEVLYDDGDFEKLNDSELRAAGRAHRRYASRRAAAAAPSSPFASSAGGGFTVLDVLVDPGQPTMAALRSAVETIAKADKETRPDVEDNKRPLYLKLPVRPAPCHPLPSTRTARAHPSNLVASQKINNVTWQGRRTRFDAVRVRVGGSRVD